MNKIGIYVFSGTGNTLKCANELKTALDSLEVSNCLYQITADPLTVSEKDIVLCYPVHGFNAPNIMIDFCKDLPSTHGNVWFLKTSGEPLRLNSNSSGELLKIVQKKGYTVKSEFHYVMPYNMVFRHSDEMASLMWKTAKERILNAAEQIAAGRQIPVSPSLPAKAMSGICRIEHWFYPKNGRLFRIDGKRCTRCMKCVNSCPTKNIRFEDGQFRFGKNCIGCVRCSFQCPSEAIRIGLINFMRVNGPYDFNRDSNGAIIGKYCKKAYKRYFEGGAETGIQANRDLAR